MKVARAVYTLSAIIGADMFAMDQMVMTIADITARRPSRSGD